MKHLRQIVEKWNTDYETPESEKGKYKGWSLEELRAALNKPGSDKKELNFAIRAKTGWGKVKEETKLDETSKEKIGRYLPKARQSQMQAAIYKDSGTWNKREKGQDLAYKQLHKKATDRDMDVFDSGYLPQPKKKKVGKVGWKGMENDVPDWGVYRKEETEQLDELKKSTLRDYIKTSTADLGFLHGDADPEMKAPNRREGIYRAADRLSGQYKTKIKGSIAPFKPGMKYKKYHAEETELNEQDTIELTVPLFIRMLEYAKEDAKTDMDLHKATENILSLQNGKALDMDSYDDIVEDVEQLYEISKAKAAKVAKAELDAYADEWKREPEDDEDIEKFTDDSNRRLRNRRQGHERAIKRLAKEETEQLDEKRKTKAEKQAKFDDDVKRASRGMPWLGSGKNVSPEELAKGLAWKGYHWPHKKIKEETEQLDEVRHRVGRKTPYSKKVIVKTKGQLAKEKSGRIKLAKGAAREAKKTGEKVKIQPFGDWRKIRASAKRKIKE